MARDVMTNAEMQASINAGIPVLYKGKVLKTLAQLPDDAQILLDYPEYAYTRIEGNARGLLGYEITGTPADGVVPQFDGTNKRWNLNTVSGGGSVPGSNKQMVFNNSGAFGATSKITYSESDPQLISLIATPPNIGMTISESGSTPPSTGLQGYPELLHLHVTNASTYWALGYSNEASSFKWANFETNDGTLTFSCEDSTDSSRGMGFEFNPGSTGYSSYSFSNKGIFFGNLSNLTSGIGGLAEVSAGSFGLALSTTWSGSSGVTTPLVWSSSGIQLYPLTASAGGTNELRFLELAANGSNYVGFKAPDAITTNKIWTLPSVDGTNGQFLSTNGSGVLGWATATGASPAGSGSEIQARSNGTTFKAVTGSSSTDGDIKLVGQVASGGYTLLDLTPAANTAIASEIPNFVVRAATQTTNATVTNYRFNQFLAPTLASDASRTTTRAATLYVDGAPNAGTNMSITTPLAFWVGGGNVQLDGFLGVGTNAPATTQFYVKSQSSGNVAALIDSAAGAGVNILQVRRDTTDVFVVANDGKISHTPVASTSATPRFQVNTAADVTLGTSTESPYLRFGGDSSGATVIRQWNSGALTLQRENIFVAPTYSFTGASTLTTAATVSITGAPVAGTNATITNPLALNIEAGQTRFPNGTASAPSVSFGSNNYGFYRGGNAGNAIVTAVNGNAWVLFADANTGAAVMADSNRPIGWGTASTGTFSSMFSGGGTGIIRMGASADAASPVAQTLTVQSVVAGTSNTAGADWTFKGSAGTGTGIGGDLIFQVAQAGSTGTTQNSYSEALRITSSGGASTNGVKVTGKLMATAGSMHLGGGLFGSVTFMLSSSFSDTSSSNGMFAMTSSGGLGRINFRNTLDLVWSNSGDPISGTYDLYLRRAGAANLAHGATDAAAPVAQTISVQNVVAGTSNTAGADWTFAASRGTGTGAGGSIIFQTAPAGSTGTSQNALTNAFTINSSGQILAGSDGSISLPIYSRSGSTNTGIYFPGVNQVGIVANGTSSVTVSSFSVTYSPSIIHNWNADTYFRRGAAATFTFGAADTNPPVAQTISVQNATGTNIAGANWTFAASRGTGTGAGGSIIFQTAAAGSSGTSQNSAATRLTIPTTGGIVIEPAAGAAPTASGTIAYDSTSNVVKAGVNGATVELTTWPVSTYILAQPGSSQTILRIVFDRAVNIPAQSDGTNAYVKSGVAATAQTDFTVKKNGTTFATLRFAAAGTQATWQSATSTDFAAGDMLTIVAPSSQDATLADIAFTITTKLK
jgi:hypothetical protein